MVDDEITGALSRRRFLGVGGGALASAALAGWVDPLNALAATRWPGGQLSAGDAVRVRDSQFMPVSQFVSWHRALDRIGPVNQRGLRATGAPAHEGYIDELHDQLERAGVSGLRAERVPMKRWTASEWSLELTGGSAAGQVRTASYIPYSGQTPAEGVSGPLVYLPPGSAPAAGSLVGKIALVDVPLTEFPLSTFTALSYPGTEYDPHHLENPRSLYKRPYENNMVALLGTLATAGAAGVVAILDYPAAAADGSYFPYDGIFRSTPGLYVDRDTGAMLVQQAQAGAGAQLRLPAEITDTTTRNLIGFIPGRSEQLVALHCHSDGSNAIEDNGPGAIVAISQYLARLPRHALPHSIMILLTAGHFHGGNGSIAFRHRHNNGLVARTNAAITIEHLGTQEWLETSPGHMALTGRPEAGAVFAPGSPALVSAAHAAMRRAATNPVDILKPLSPTASGTADDPVWPGEGQYLYGPGIASHRIVDANYITGPTYLLNWGIDTFDKIHHGAVRAQAIAFTEMILALGRSSRPALTRTSL